MDSLRIKRPVTVKVQVTDEFRILAAARVQEEVKKLETELLQLDLQGKKLLLELEKQNPQGVEAARQHLEAQRQKRVENKNQLLGKLKEIGKWTNGSEILQGTLETYTDLKVGDDWNEIFGVEVILRDNKVVEIRTP